MIVLYTYRTNEIVLNRPLEIIVYHQLFLEVGKSSEKPPLFILLEKVKSSVKPQKALRFHNDKLKLQRIFSIN